MDFHVGKTRICIFASPKALVSGFPIHMRGKFEFLFWLSKTTLKATVRVTDILFLERCNQNKLVLGFLSLTAESTHPPLQFRTPKSDRKFHEQIICLELSNMLHKHDMFFSLKSLGLLTPTHPQSRKKSYKNPVFYTILTLLLNVT